MNDSDEEEVGYGRPPKRHQFKKGQSGNPRGRPRKPLSVPEIIGMVRDELIPITINGKKKKVSLVEAAIRQNVAQALRAKDPRHLDKLLATLEKYGVTPQHVMAEQHRRDAEAVVQKLFRYLENTFSSEEDMKDVSEDQET